jgi:hypothetical protein
VEDTAYDLLREIERQVIELGKANNTLNQEIRRTTRRKAEGLADFDDEGIEGLTPTPSSSWRKSSRAKCNLVRCGRR